MRFLLVLTCAVVCSTALIAQPVLGTQTLPAPGSRFTLTLADTSGVLHGTAGVGQVWDYTSLTKRVEKPDTALVRTVRPDQLPPDVAQLFPMMDRAVVDDTTTTPFLVTPTMLRMLGTVTPSADVAISESDPYDVRPVELRFGEPHLDSFTATITPRALPIEAQRYGEHQLIYDGSGMLLLPGSDPIQCARITVRRTTWDTVRLGPTVTVVTSQVHLTSWVSEVSDERFLEVETQVISRSDNGVPIGEPVTVRSVRYRVMTATSVDEEPTTGSLIIAPQPVSTRSVMVRGLTTAPLSVRLVSLTGSSIPATIESYTGPEGARIELPQVSDGWYVLEFQSACATGNCLPQRVPILIMSGE